MTRRSSLIRYGTAVLLTIGAVVLGGLNVHQQRQWTQPDDGGAWLETPAGVEAQMVVPDGPAARAGVREGDIVAAVNGERVRNELHLTQILYGLGIWSKATYTIRRQGATIETTLVIEPPYERLRRQRTYLEIIGLLYILVGISVLAKRWRTPHSLHFHLICVISFVLYVFHSTGKFDMLDWTVFWVDLGAYVLLPPLFLHFCLKFPGRKRWVEQQSYKIPAIYLPGTLLFLVWVGFVLGILGSMPSRLVLRNFLDGLGEFYFGLFFVLSAAVLLHTYVTARNPEIRQQMKWVTGGTVVAVVPYFLLQSVPRLMGIVPSGYVDIAVFPLVFIPISFGYAIHRYRLMDVDILFKQGVTYTLATALVIGLYATLVVLVGELFGASVPTVGTVARVVATIIAALLFAPIKDQIQVWLDRVFYKDRYDPRQTLIEFGRTLGTDVHVDSLLDRIVERLGRALFVGKVAVFLEDPADRSRFVVARTNGVSIPRGTELPFLTGSTGRSHILANDSPVGLSCFVPCRVQDRVIAYVGLGETENGRYLTSEDIKLLEAVSGYIGIALENAALYRSIEQKAAEYQHLKDFNEDIIESVTVGVMAEDFQLGIVLWNRALERLTGRTQSEVFGKRIEEVIPQPTLDRLFEQKLLYKHRWGDLTVNFSVTGLFDKSGATRGRLIIVDDITERVRLESQLVQNDKLTSIGLLAAGVAHEVNTPLAVISSYSQMLRKETSPGDVRFRLVDKIIKQSFRASEIVNNLLRFSRTKPAEFGTVNLHRIIDDTLALLEHQLDNANIRTQREFLADDPVTMGNSGRLQQVFLNLLINSKDAMTVGGVVHIRTEQVNSRIQVLIEDTGTGISPENVEKIYDPFFTTKAAGRGTGLGLSVSYGIIQEHGGAISVESEPGKGTSFRLELPLAARKTIHA